MHMLNIKRSLEASRRYSCIAIHSPVNPVSATMQPVLADLVNYLGKITGAAFPIFSTSQQNAIEYMLASSSGAPSDIVTALDGAGYQAFYVRGDANSLKFVANTEAGLSLATYHYLERIGVRWLLPGDVWTNIPQKNDITLSEDRLIVMDYYNGRHYFGTGGFTGVYLPGWADGADKRPIFGQTTTDWMRRMRIGSSPVAAANGESFNDENEDDLVANPSYLAKVGGEYSAWSLTAKLNAGNPNAVDFFCDWAIAKFAAARAGENGAFVKHLYIEAPDGYAYGDNTAELVAAGVGDGSSSDQVWFVANECARRLRVLYADASVSLLAYAGHADPPTFDLEPNVSVALVPYAYRTGTKTQNLSTDEFIDLWSTKVADDMGIYHYWGITDWTYEQPTGVPFTWVIDLVPYWLAKGCKSASIESSYGAGSNGLNWYVGTRLMIDSSQGSDAIVNEWLSLAFGRAKVPMRRMFLRWPYGGYYTLSNDSAQNLIDIQEARTLAAQDKVVQARVDAFAKYIHYLRIYMEFLREPDAEIKKTKRIDVAKYALSIIDSMMLHTTRLYDKLAAQDLTNFNTQFAVNPDGAAWQDVREITTSDIDAFIADGLATHPVRYNQRLYSGDLTPLQQIVWSAPSGDPWGPIHWTGGAIQVALLMPSGLSALPLRISQESNIALRIRDLDGNLVYSEDIPKVIPSQTIDLSIPLTPGRYTVYLTGDGTYSIKSHKGVPFTFSPLSNVWNWSANSRYYFYVPSGVEKIAAFVSAVPTNVEIYDPDGTSKTITRIDNNYTQIVDIPQGQDGAIWSLRGLYAEPIMFTTPRAFSLEPQVLMVPSDAL